MDDLHPMIALFQGCAEATDATGQKPGLDDAITMLAGWMELAESHLTEDDLAVLAEIGGIMYEEAFNRRLRERGKDSS